MSKKKEKLKEFSKRYLLGFVFSIIMPLTVTVYAQGVFPSNQATYINTESGMNSQNVQDAIEELYDVCS